MKRGVCCFALAVITVGLFGCHATKSIDHERLSNPADIFAHVRQRNEKIQTLLGDGLVTVESPEGSNNGSFEVRVKKPDSLRLEFHGPFGVRAGTLLLSRHQFIYYNEMDNTAITGNPDGTTLRSMFRLKLNFDEVLHVFTGEFPTAQQGDSALNFSATEDRYILRYRTANGEKEYMIDGESFIVTRYRVIDSTGQEVLTASASRIRMSDDNIPVPKLLRVAFPRERRSVTIAFDDVQLNRPTDCHFLLPKQAEVINRE